MAINAPCQQILAFKVSVFTTVIVFIANVSTHMSWWMMIATNHLQPQAMILFQFCYKLMVGLWAALEQEPTKQEFLSVPTHLCSGVFIQYTLVNSAPVVYIHTLYSAPEWWVWWGCHHRRKWWWLHCIELSTKPWLPTLCHCTGYIVTLHWLHCIAYTAFVTYSVKSTICWVSCWLILIIPHICHFIYTGILCGWNINQIGQTLCVRSYTAVKSLYIL